MLRRALVPSCCSRGSTQPGHLGRAVHKRSAGAPGLTESLSCRLLAGLCRGQDTVCWDQGVLSAGPRACKQPGRRRWSCCLPLPAAGAAAPQPSGTPLHHLCAACSGRSFAYGWVIRAVWWEQRMCRALVIQSVVLAENMFTTFPLLQHCPFQPAHRRLIHNCLGCLAGTMESMPLKWGWIGCQGSQEGHLMNRAQPLISLRSPGWREPPGWQKPWLKRRLNQGLACVTGAAGGKRGQAGPAWGTTGQRAVKGALGVMAAAPLPLLQRCPQIST